MSVPGAPSAKEKKYDRQLRLWAANGQEALEKAHVCLINATAAGTEILKNLVLPGIGQYTIIDDAVVGESDLGSNFFLDEQSLGKPRAKRTCELLQELNPDAKGEYIVDNISNVILIDPTRLSSFTLVIVTGPVSSAVVLGLDKTLYDLSIPLFIVKSVGFVVTCRLALAEHTIIESHPDSIVDLRLLQPFEALSELAKERTKFLDDKEKMSAHEHGHVPYILVLLKYLEDWKASHEGKIPQNYGEKNEFKKMIRAGMRTPDDENYEEAIAAVLKNLNPSVVPSDTQKIFQDGKCIHLTPASKPFWIVARAISLFVTEKNNGLLPLPGALPDMKAESKGYIQLQNVYKVKARADLGQVMDFVKSILTSLQRSENEISEAEVEAFCKHAGYAKLIRGRSLQQEYSTDIQSKTITNNINDPTSMIHFYLAMRAYENHIANSKENRPPGINDESLEEDTTSMMAYIKDLCAANNILTDEETVEASKKAVSELVRAGDGELHNISSLAGGMVAQEIIKTITRQYIVMNNTVVFDGISSRSEVFVL